MTMTEKQQQQEQEQEQEQEQQPAAERLDMFGIEPRINTKGSGMDPNDDDAHIRGPDDDG